MKQECNDKHLLASSLYDTLIADTNQKVELNSTATVICTTALHN